MNYTQFTKKLLGEMLGTQVSKGFEFLGHTIALSEDNKVFINKKQTSFESIDEAKAHLEMLELKQEITKEIYEDIPNIKIANLIREYHDIKVTDTLIESYINLASTKTFTLDPVVLELREFNSLTTGLNKIDYILEDGSCVAISYSTQKILEELLHDKYKLIDYMRESKQNFVRIIKELS